MLSLKRLALASLPSRLIPPLAARAALLIDEPELHLLPVLCDKHRTSIDVGANIGTYTALLERESSKVIAVEPHPVLAARLRRAFPRRVQVLQTALSDAAGIAEIRIPVVAGREVDTRSSLEASANAEFETRLLRVQLMTLDSLVPDEIGLIKIDVEGHELRVLQGGKNLLEKQRPRILIEIEDRHRREAVRDTTAFLLHLGYRGFFSLHRSLRSIEDFDVRRHQPEILSKVPAGSRAADYVNNFIFLPAADCERLLPELQARLLGLAGWRRWRSALEPWR